MPSEVACGSHGREAMNLLRRFRRSATIALILSPTGLLLIAVTRLLIISNYNPVTASAIVSSSGYANTLLGTVIPLAPIFMPYIALVLLFFRRVIPGILAFVTAALISPTKVSRANALDLLLSDCKSVYRWGSTHAIVAIVAVIGVTLLLATFGLGFNMFIRTTGTIASLALIPAIVYLYPLPYKNNFYSQELRQPWLPAETVVLNSGREVTGYVLSGDGDWLVVLRNDTRRVVDYHASMVAKRHACQIGQGRALRPLVTLAPAVTEVPRCAESSAGSSHREPASRVPRRSCPPPAPVQRHARPIVPLTYRNYLRCT